ncbi:MAG: FliH/SctL family protein [Armatimonadota bacterium]
MNGRGRRVLKRAELDAREMKAAWMERSAGGSGDGPTAESQPAVEPPAGAVEADEVDRMRRLVQAILSGFARQRRELLSELQPYVVRIAVEVARRIVQRELRTDPGMVSRTVGSALEEVATAAETRVRVHPLDAQVLQSTIREIVPTPDEAASLKIIPDGSIERGGCVVESDRGIVDARLQTQFEEMQARLLDGLDAARTTEADGGRGGDAR